ncbi:MAG: PEP-CTERM sorting domain-containing protein [Tepidisphaeraceae bacterium]
MRKLILVAAAAAAVTASSSAFAAFTFTTETVSAGVAGFDRINLIMKSDSQPNTSIGAISVDVLAGSNVGTVGDGAPAATFPVGAPGVLQFQTGLSSATVTPTTVVNQLHDAPVYGAIKSFANLAGDSGLVTVATPLSSAKATYAAGVARFNVVGAAPATPAVFTTNDLGSGLIIGSAYVPTGTKVRFLGNADDDFSAANGVASFDVIVGGGSANTAPVFGSAVNVSGDADVTAAGAKVTVDFKKAFGTKSFTLFVPVTDDVAVTSFTAGAAPAGVVLGAATAVAGGYNVPVSVTRTNPGSVDPLGTVVFTAADAGALSSQFTVTFAAIPEPSTLAGLAGMALLGLRRRK